LPSVGPAILPDGQFNGFDNGYELGWVNAVRRYYCEYGRNPLPALKFLMEIVKTDLAKYAGQPKRNGETDNSNEAAKPSIVIMGSVAGDKKVDGSGIADQPKQLQTAQLQTRETEQVAITGQSEPPEGNCERVKGKETETETAITLKEFILEYCENGDKLSPNVFDSRINYIKRASRNVNSCISLPEHVGKWKTGQSKRYYPSQLIEKWPEYQKVNPSLPPLKSDENRDKRH
jgi:hypothetical protein